VRPQGRSGEPILDNERLRLATSGTFVLEEFGAGGAVGSAHFASTRGHTELPVVSFVDGPGPIDLLSEDRVHSRQY
jgi:hypothetical protein